MKKRRGNTKRKRSIESIKKQSASVKNKKLRQSVSDLKPKPQLRRRDRGCRKRLRPQRDKRKRRKHTG